MEQRVQLEVNGEERIFLIATPIHMEELAIGFLFNQDLINSTKDIISYHVCNQMERIEIWLTHPIHFQNSLQRSLDCFADITPLVDDGIQPVDYQNADYPITRVFL